jgi:hypothetical protein
MKRAELHLPYFKQGDDLAHHLSQTKSVEEALEAHAAQLDFAASILRKVREMVSNQGVSIEADTHYISIEGPDEVIEALIDSKHATKVFDDEHEDEGSDLDLDERTETKEGWDSVF